MIMALLNPKNHPLNVHERNNLDRLLFVLNKIEGASGINLVVNRGYSTVQEQIDIYAAINETRVKRNASPLNVPLHSAHMVGAAADVSDRDGRLWKFLFENEALRLELGIALEARENTPTWVHIQIYLPKSGLLIFKP